MIAKLTGTLDDAGSDWAVIDVAGVGYLVHCSARTLDGLGIRGDTVTIHTELQVSENDMRLIGFASGAERDWFRMLTGVQGVGSKMALAVLSAFGCRTASGVCTRRCSASRPRARCRPETRRADCQRVEGQGWRGSGRRHDQCSATAARIDIIRCCLGLAESWLQARHCDHSRCQGNRRTGGQRAAG